MPTPLPDYRVLHVALLYLSHRQEDNRPTTIRQFTGRMGLGKERLLGMLVKAGVSYVLFQHSDTLQKVGNQEIVLIKLPDGLAGDLGLDNKVIHRSYLKLFKRKKPQLLLPREVVPVPEGSPGDVLSPEEMADPHFLYRINQEQFDELKDHLIKRDELFRIAKERGYGNYTIHRAIGGQKMRWVLAGPAWRPYYYKHQTYFHKDVLKVLHQSDRLYKNPRTAIWKRYLREARNHEYANPGLFVDEKLKDYLVR